MSAGTRREFATSLGSIINAAKRIAKRDFTGHAIQDLLGPRDITFNDSQVLAKEQEEALLYRDMLSDLVTQIMRRLQAAKVK